MRLATRLMQDLEINSAGRRPRARPARSHRRARVAPAALTVAGHTPPFPGAEHRHANTHLWPSWSRRRPLSAAAARPPVRAAAAMPPRCRERRSKRSSRAPTAATPIAATTCAGSRSRCSSFIGVRPGMVVLDVSAGGGYTTELLARAVAPSGRVYGTDASAPPGATLAARLQDACRGADRLRRAAVRESRRPPKSAPAASTSSR